MTTYPTYALDPMIPGPFMHDARYRLLVESITDYAICMLSPSGTVASWNKGAERFTGYKAPEILGSHFSRFYTPENHAAGLPDKALRTALSEGRFENEGWRLRKDGQKFWAHVVVYAIRDSDGTLAGFAMVTRDLTERKHAAESLRNSEQQFRLLVNAVTDYAIYMLDPTGKITSWNVGAARIKGYSADEIIGEHFSCFYTPEDAARGEPERSLDVARRSGSVEKEGWRVRKDGSRFWASVVLHAIRGSTGQLLGFAKVTRDMTERRKAQEELDRAQEALMQSQKMDAIGQLTGGVAHDFNNLLMVILGNLELLRIQERGNPRTSALIGNAVQAVNRGSMLTQRMLAFARRQSLNLAAIDVRRTVADMIDLLQRTLGPSIRVETRFPDESSPVRADLNQFELAVLNLCLNARDAMPNGGTLVIAAREEQVGVQRLGGLSPGRYACVSISDTGIGMDEETLQKAMEPFFTTKGVGQGPGLGLPMVHGLAKQTGGALYLKSKPGVGTTAEMWLPIASQSDGAYNVPSEEEETRNAATCLKIVVVDDDDLVLTSLVFMLEELGHQALGASTADEAIALLRRTPGVDLVLTDYSMPGQNGWQLAQAIKAEWPAIRVVLASGFAELPLKLEVDFPRLIKPIAMSDLEHLFGDAKRSQ